MTLNGEEHCVRTGSIVHIPPASCMEPKVRAPVVGIPDLADDDLYSPDD
ncbi:MAG: hypothetical protein AAF961_12740 [Planctomycetota bacterium]